MADQSTGSNPIKIARSLLQQRKVQEGLALLKELVAANDTDREAQELLGMALFMSRQFTEARDAFERLVRLDPMYATAWVNLGAVQNVLDDHQGAVKSLRKAIQRDKRSASAYYNMAIAQRAMKMNSMAISAYREAIKIDPKMAEAYTNLGNIYIEMNNLSKAVRLLEDGVSSCPNVKKLQAVLAKAKRAKEGVQREDKPLGRLVDEEELSKKQIRTAPRVLDDAQRVQERESLQEHGRAIRHATKPLVDLLKGPLRDQLHILDLAVAQNDTRGEAPSALGDLAATLQEIEKLRTAARLTSSEIRNHLQKTDPGF